MVVREGDSQGLRFRVEATFLASYSAQIKRLEWSDGGDDTGADSHKSACGGRHEWN